MTRCTTSGSRTSHHPVAYVSTTEIEWPPAQEHPFFYIGIYAAISLAAGFVNIAGVITQYTGALRASRKLFRQLLVTVVRATMRWQDRRCEYHCTLFVLYGA